MIVQLFKVFLLAFALSWVTHCEETVKQKYAQGEPPPSRELLAGRELLKQRYEEAKATEQRLRMRQQTPAGGHE